METQSKNIAVSGYYGFDNFGDEAILKVLTTELKKNNYSVTVFSKNPDKTSKNLDVKSSYTFDLKGISKTLKSTDILISGGGSLLQDVTSIKSLLYYLFVIAYALLKKKEVVIFAQGIGPINNPLCGFLTKLCLKNCKHITVRDAKSKEFLENWEIESQLVSDPVWNIELKPKPQRDKKCLGIQLRSWSTLTQTYLKKLADTVVKEFSDYDIKIYSLQDALDLDLCEKFAQRLKKDLQNSNIEVVKALSVSETVDAFADLDCMIAMRYHACMLALKYGIPTMALSYDVKVEKLANAFDIPCSLLDETENIDNMVSSLKTMNTDKIIEEANDRKFDFVEFCKALEK